MSTSVLSSLKHEAQPSVLGLDKTRTADVVQLILAVIFRFGVNFRYKIGRKV